MPAYNALIFQRLKTFPLTKCSFLIQLVTVFETQTKRLMMTDVL